ncbi:tyrosine-type recombinase/integrase [Ferrimonas balearica]|nr:tyrosine-type recombinase/integrase [Ferrimonas balearica]
MKHLNRSGTFPSGNARFYFRPKGQRGVPLPDLPTDHPEWLSAYSALLAAHDGGKPSPEVRHRTGTIGAALRAYMASDHFLGLASSTRGTRRRMIEDIEALYGRGVLADLLPRHIRQDLARLPPHPANNRLRVWRAFGRWCVDAGLIDADPSRDVRKRATAVTEGYKAWGRADVAAFRLRWPHDSQQRLAFELMHRTCASIGDACRLGPGMVKDGWLHYRRQKSGSEAACPFSVPGPDWFEADDHLARCLATAPRHMTFITAKSGAARSHKSAAQWFSRACDEAGLPELSAHGIRKHRASVFKENGATPEQRMAILGHESQSEATRYSKSADLQKIVCGTESSKSAGSKFQLG